MDSNYLIYFLSMLSSKYQNCELLFWLGFLWEPYGSIYGQMLGMTFFFPQIHSLVNNQFVFHINNRLFVQLLILALGQFPLAWCAKHWSQTQISGHLHALLVWPGLGHENGPGILESIEPHLFTSVVVLSIFFLGPAKSLCLACF